MRDGRKRRASHVAHFDDFDVAFLGAGQRLIFGVARVRKVHEVGRSRRALRNRRRGA